MTSNATAYFQVVEQGRSNRAQEQETHRKNVASEQHNAAVLAETYRHNLITEQQQRAQMAEAYRHNLAQEHLSHLNLELDWSRLGETARANRAQEAELFRSHSVQETEAMRHNRSTELAGYINSGSALLRGVSGVMSAQASKRQAQTAAERSKWEEKQGQHRIAQGYVKSAVDISNSLVNWRNASTNRLKVGVEAAGKLIDLKKLFK